MRKTLNITGLTLPLLIEISFALQGAKCSQVTEHGCDDVLPASFTVFLRRDDMSLWRSNK
jgi:hypothetical protein